MNPFLIFGLPGAKGIAVSGSDLFVANASSGTVGAYTTAGAPVNPDLISGLSGPSGIAISGSSLFVTNSGSGTIGEYTTSGTPVNPDLISGLSGPSGIAVVPSAAVPEPATLGLMVLGLLGAGFAGRRRQN